MDDELKSYLGEGAAFFAPPDLGIGLTTPESKPKGTSQAVGTGAQTHSSPSFRPQTTAAGKVDLSIRRAERTPDAQPMSRGQSVTTSVPNVSAVPASSPQAAAGPQDKGEPVFVPDIVFAPPPVANSASPVTSGGEADQPPANYYQPGGSTQREGRMGTGAVVGLGILAVVALWWMSQKSEQKHEVS